MANPGKPKNDGAILTVRVSRATHSQIIALVQRRIDEGMRPGLATKTRVVEQAVELLFHSETAKALCEACGFVLPDHGPGCVIAIPAVPKVWGKPWTPPEEGGQS